MLLYYHNEVKITFNILNIKCTNTISTSIPTSYSCFLESLSILESLYLAGRRPEKIKVPKFQI